MAYRIEKGAPIERMDTARLRQWAASRYYTQRNANRRLAVALVCVSALAIAGGLWAVLGG